MLCESAVLTPDNISGGSECQQRCLCKAKLLNYAVSQHLILKESGSWGIKEPEKPLTDGSARFCGDTPAPPGPPSRCWRCWPRPTLQSCVRREKWCAWWCPEPSLGDRQTFCQDVKKVSRRWTECLCGLCYCLAFTGKHIMMEISELFRMNLNPN